MNGASELSPRWSSPGSDDQWFATDGVSASGPMAFAELAGSVAIGRIDGTSFVRHSSWAIWQRYTQVGELTHEARDRAVERYAEISRSAEARATDPKSVPPPPLASEPPASRRETPAPMSHGRPAAVNPVGVLARARTLDGALHLALSTAVAASRADAGLVHRYRRDVDRLVTSHAMGEEAEGQLGNRLGDEDPSVESARSGRTVIAEGWPGAAGCHVAGRLAPLLGEVSGAAMVPITVFGRLHGMVEVGRRTAPFFAREVARVEDVVEALTARAVVAGWFS